MFSDEVNFYVKGEVTKKVCPVCDWLASRMASIKLLTNITVEPVRNPEGEVGQEEVHSSLEAGLNVLRITSARGDGSTFRQRRERKWGDKKSEGVQKRREHRTLRDANGGSMRSNYLKSTTGGQDNGGLGALLICRYGKALLPDTVEGL